MKFAIAILAVFIAAIALPACAVRSVRRVWAQGRGRRTASGLSGASLATLILRYGRVSHIGVVEGGKLFYERFDPSARDVVLSREVHQGRSPAALAHAALCAGHALQHEAAEKPFRRLAFWNNTSRLIVNVLPFLLLFMLLHPGSWRSIPLLAAFFFLMAAIQVLTFPAARTTATRVRDIILEHRLLPPAEIEEFQRALKSASERHLAAPLLDCFWLRWLLRAP
jgi:Zn-dependent membrane protease YugP